jgi:hypothetical protein
MKLGMLLTVLVMSGCGGSEAPHDEAKPAEEKPAEPAKPAEAPVAAPAANAPSADDCTAAVNNRGALQTNSGKGNLGVDSRQKMVEECQGQPWTAEKVACVKAATTWEQIEACDAAPGAAPAAEGN